MGLALATALGLATGALQKAQQGFLRLPREEASPETAATGLAIRIAPVLRMGAIGLLLISAARGQLGGKMVLLTRC
jgi:hypothetical protein